MQVNKEWWSASGEELIKQLGANPEKGLSSDQVQEMRSRYGSNALQGAGASSLWTLFLQSIKSPMMVLLLTIAAISLVLAQYREAIVMVFVVFVYIGVELFNKARSDRTMAKLRELQAITANVLRDSKIQEIPVQDVVVGDILPLQAGSLIPADARLLSSAGLLVNEGSLTGESAPVIKDASAQVKPDTPLAERPTAVFAGTTVLDGQGKAVVVAVGSMSELGRIAKLSAVSVSEPTPLQKEMNDLARTLAFVAIGVSFLIPLTGLILGYNLHQMILTWLSLTFLMVPGQPPVIITMALALAAFELAQKKVIVKRLQGAETLGSVDVIASDKTGTMTENKMVLSAILAGNGDFIPVNEEYKDILSKIISKTLPSIPEVTNNPTDVAIKNVADSLGMKSYETGHLINQVGFVKAKGYRSLEYSEDGEKRLYVTGNPEFIIEHSTRYEFRDEILELNQSDKDKLKSQVQKLSAEGKRITAYAYHVQQQEGIEPDNLTFICCAVIDDPVRPEVNGAIKILSSAGIHTIMVTGDNQATAGFIADSIGLDTSKILTGADIDKLSDEQLKDVFAWLLALNGTTVGQSPTSALCSQSAKTTQVFARITPEHKLRIVKALEQSGQVVAVTGDGVNDAPALRTANIGITMGIRGTDAAKEAADLILTDDNFARLPDGVAIGRKAYDNFRKGITYYLSAKAILLTIFIAPLFLRLPFPLSPIQIIFTELLMDLASSTIFVTEPAEKDIMQRKPRRQVSFLSHEVGLRILRNLAGLSLAILTAYFVSLYLGYGETSARTAASATWLIGHILLALNLKQEHTPLLKQGLFSNRFGTGWLIGMILFVLSMTNIPAVQKVLNTTNLTSIQWIIVVTGAILASFWIEVYKLIKFRG